MRIRVYSHLHRPDRGGGASIFTDLSEGLAQRGHEVELCCAYSYYPEWENKTGASLWRRERKVVNGVRVTRHGLFIPRDPGSTIQRAAYEASYAMSLARSAVRATDVDAVIAFLPLLSSGVASVLDSTVGAGAPTWINVQDLSGRAAAAYAGHLSAGLTRVEEAVLGRSSLITTIAPQMSDELAHLGRPDRPVVTFPNWLHSTAETSIVRATDRLSGVAEDADRLGRRRPIRILYAGNIGKKQGVDRIVTMLASTDASFEFEICGAGAGAPDVDAVLPTADRRFRRRPFLSEDEFIDRLLWADVFCVPELPTAAASFLPSKLLPATAAGTPILALAGANSPLRDEVEAHGIGALADWDDPGSVVRVATDLRQQWHDEHGPLRSALRDRATAQSSASAIDRAEALLAEMVAPGADATGRRAAPRVLSTTH